MTEDVVQETTRVLKDLMAAAPLDHRHLLVIGVSTSEVIGERIGTKGSHDVAAAVFSAVERIRENRGFHVAYQCCEHLNRALVVQKQTLEQFHLTEVTVVPVPNAGGSMAAYAFRAWSDAVVVESVQAHAGIDIGDTLIGMHLRPVAVPVRPSLKAIGAAHVTMARTRPKLIGGARAVYGRDETASASSEESPGP